MNINSINWNKLTTGGPKFQKYSSLASLGGLTAGGIMDNLNAPDDFGRRAAGTAALSKGLQLGAVGLQTAGPIGAAVGGAIGLVSGFLQQRKLNKQGDMDEYRYELGQAQEDATRSSIAYSNLNYGTTWARLGGSLTGPIS